MTVEQPLSETLLDAIATARAHGGELVRRSWFRGCWTWRDCPADPRAGSLLQGDRPVWSVTDNTIHALIRRGIATVTHTRDDGRPAVVRVKSESEIAPKPQVVELVDRTATVRLIDRSQNTFMDLKITAGERVGNHWSLELTPIEQPPGMYHEAA